MNKQKTALLTGITGQCGSYMAEILLEKGYKVIGIKRRTSLLDAHKRLEHIYGHSNFKLVYGNLMDTTSLWRLINEYKPDEFYNFGAMSHVRVSFEVPMETIISVAQAPLIILEAIKELSPHTRFYQASSSEMFGIAECPINGYTEWSPMMPVSPYACAKVFGYNITRNYRDAYDLFAANGILHNNESVRRGETFVTRKVTMGVAKIKLGLQDKLFLGNLDAYRDWGFSKDYMEGAWLMLQQDKADDYILATGVAHSVREMCDYVFSLADLDYKKYVEIDKRLLRPQEVPFLVGNNSKAKEKLGWEPKYTFEMLLKEMYEEDLKLIAKQNGLENKLIKYMDYTLEPNEMRF